MIADIIEAIEDIEGEEKDNVEGGAIDSVSFDVIRDKEK